VTLSGVLRFFHVSNLENASDEEAMYFFRLLFQLKASAKRLARESGGKFDRAYVAFSEAVESETK
jgi:hypothetical protein